MTAQEGQETRKPASPLPWIVQPKGIDPSYTVPPYVDAANDQEVCCVLSVGGEQDADYIAEACNAYPQLQAEIARLSTALEEARNQGEMWRQNLWKAAQTNRELTTALEEARQERDEALRRFDSIDQFDGTPVSFAALMDSIDSKWLEEQIYDLVIWHIRRGDKAERERDEARQERDDTQERLTKLRENESRTREHYLAQNQLLRNELASAKPERKYGDVAGTWADTSNTYAESDSHRALLIALETLEQEMRDEYLASPRHGESQLKWADTLRAIRQPQKEEH